MSRTRSKTTTYDGRTNLCRINNDVYGAGSWTNYANYYRSEINLTTSMTDEITPGYYSKVRSGEFLTVNPMSQSGVTRFEWSPKGLTRWITTTGSQVSMVEVDHSLGLQAIWDHATSNVNWTPQYFSGSYSDSLRTSSDLATEALARARTKSLDAGTFLAEFNKTVAMIYRFKDNVFKRADKIINDKSLHISQRGFAGFAETWLEGRYGWRTLAYDLDDIREAIEKIKDSEWRQFSRAYASDEVEGLYTTSNVVAAHYRAQYAMTSNNRSSIDWTLVQTGRKVGRAGAMIELICEDIAFIDPLVTAWEVIPFSFIVDWFTNIGDAIAAYSPFATGDLVGLWYSEREEITSRFDARAVPWTIDPTNSKVEGLTSGWAEHVLTTASRTPLSPPLFNLSFRLNLDWKKLVDLASIVGLRYLGLLKDIRKLTRT